MHLLMSRYVQSSRLEFDKQNIPKSSLYSGKNVKMEVRKKNLGPRRKINNKIK